MSRNCQVFFNAKSEVKLKGFSSLDVDLRLSHDYVDDRELIFSRYSCELCTYKLLPDFSARIVDSFVRAYAEIRNCIDFGTSPMLVFDIQELVGFLSVTGGIEYVDGTGFWRADPVMVELVGALEQ